MEDEGGLCGARVESKSSDDLDRMKDLVVACEDAEERAPPPRKKRRGCGNVQSLLEAVISRQQQFFTDLLESIERKEQIREQIRQEREDKWRAEERAQLGVFNNALMALTRELVGDGAGLPSVTGLLLGSRPPRSQVKSRVKNWKRGEVLQLIKLRGEMDSRFAMSSRRAGLWDEVGERLTGIGIRRDGKQCREKWDKLMAMYKDVCDGTRDRDESPYFGEMTSVLLRRPGTAA